MTKVGGGDVDGIRNVAGRSELNRAGGELDGGRRGKPMCSRELLLDFSLV